MRFFEAKSNQSKEKEKEKEQNNPLISRHLIYLLKSLQRGHVELFDLGLDLDLDLELDQTSPFGIVNIEYGHNIDEHRLGEILGTRDKIGLCHYDANQCLRGTFHLTKDGFSLEKVHL